MVQIWANSDLITPPNAITYLSIIRSGEAVTVLISLGVFSVVPATLFASFYLWRSRNFLCSYRSVCGFDFNLCIYQSSRGFPAALVLRIPVISSLIIFAITSQSDTENVKGTRISKVLSKTFNVFFRIGISSKYFQLS